MVFPMFLLRRGSWWLAAVLLVTTLLIPAGFGATRQANTSLDFPQEPYGFALEDAFPGIVFAGIVAFASPPGETNRLFVVEKEGAIYVINNLSNPTKTLFLDLTGRVDAGGEGGLLGLAFHPGYASNRLFFTFYTLQTSTAAGTGLHDRLSRFQTSASNPDQAVTDSEVPLITQYDEADNHNAGDLHFGPDGYLYVALGDEGGGGFDANGNSRTITRDFFAGILRIDVDKRPGNLAPNPHPASSPEYSVPADNPFIGATSFSGAAIQPSDVRTEFWAVGMRNPWRFSIDFPTGRLFSGDVGEGSREEINLIIKGGDYGWNFREGTLAAQSGPFPGASLIPPLWEYPHGSGDLEGMSVVGGLVYRGARIPELQGSYIFGDYASGNIWAMQHDGASVNGVRRLAGLVGLAAFGRDPSNGDVLLGQPWWGPVQRLVRNNSGTALPARLSDTGAFQNLATLTPMAGLVGYDINTPFWSDHARKRRWFSVPQLNQTIAFSANGNWSFPTGTVWVKHFDLELTNGVPSSARRLETRFLVKNGSGVYGLTYQWNAAQTDATLVAEGGLDEAIVIRDGATTRTQTWRYPGRSECLACHTGAGGYAAGFNTHQLHRTRDDNGTEVNQILWLSQMGYFTSPVNSTNGLLAYASSTNPAAALDHRVRSYLGANCSHCHQPGGTGHGHWDGRLHTDWAAAGIINGPLISSLGNANSRVIRPGNLDDSMIYSRISALGPRHMPPLATSVLDTHSIAMMADWIVAGLDGAQIIAAALGPDSRMRVTFAGVAGRTYRIEAADGFGPWTAIGSVFVGASGVGEFIDPTAVFPDSLLRVYRCGWP